jgi:hypothetical protein
MATKGRAIPVGAGDPAPGSGDSAGMSCIAIEHVNCSCEVGAAHVNSSVLLLLLLLLWRGRDREVAGGREVGSR